MSVSMILQHKTTSETREVPIASQSGFEVEWMQFAQQLSLQLVPLFTGGALTTVPDELIPEITHELRLLLATVEPNPGSAWIAERVHNILDAFATTNPAEWEYSFG